VTTKLKRLSKRQLAVIEDLFAGRLEEQAVLDKHKVKRSLYNKWLNDQRFIEQFDQQINSAYRQSAAMIARYAPIAAAKLVQLTESKKPETALRACVDIITMPALSQTRPDERMKKDDEESSNNELSPETASRLLAALAAEK
jgi:hypothetical protein